MRVLTGILFACAVPSARGMVQPPAVVTTAPTASQAAPQPPPAAEVIAAFMEHVASGEFDPKAREFVIRSRARFSEPDERDFITFALAVLSPEFKKGIDASEAERPGEAADLFAELAQSPDPYLSVNAATLAAGSMLELEQIERCGTMLADVLKRHPTFERYTLCPEQFAFALGYSQVHLLDYDAARATLEGFLERYPQAPERLRVTATQIVTELSRRIPRRLGDVRDLLAFARRHLRHGDTGEQVKGRQAEAVAILNDLIDEAESREKSQASGAGKGGGQRGGAAGGSPGGGGAKQSQLYGGAAPETRLRRGQVKPGDAWGRMPPKEREAILQSLQQQFPGRYRELLEQYYRQLAEEPSAP